MQESAKMSLLEDICSLTSYVHTSVSLFPSTGGILTVSLSVLFSQKILYWVH